MMRSIKNNVIAVIRGIVLPLRYLRPTRFVRRVVLILIYGMTCATLGGLATAHIILYRGVQVGSFITSIGMKTISAGQPQDITELSPVAWVGEDSLEVPGPVQAELDKRNKKNNQRTSLFEPLSAKDKRIANRN